MTVSSLQDPPQDAGSDTSSYDSHTLFNSESTSNPQATPIMSLHSVGFSINQHFKAKRLRPKHWLNSARSNKGSIGLASSKIDITMHLTLQQSKDLLTNISLDIHPYEKMTVIGPNGAGKSTLMKLMLGLLTPTTGKLTRHPELTIGYVPQKFSVPAILPLRVEDLLAQVNMKLTKSQQALLYDSLSIQPLLKQQVLHLSGGETQRILLARSLLGKPNLLILDEPMQGLDPESERWLYEFIDDLPDFLQCAMVVVSHDLHWVMRGSRRVICLNKHICCEGQPSNLEVSEEFKLLFGRQYAQPYIHKPHDCQHTVTCDS